MQRFLKIAMTEPDISKVPFMIDSSKFKIIEAKSGSKKMYCKFYISEVGEEESVRGLA